MTCCCLLRCKKQVLGSGVEGFDHLDGVLQGACIGASELFECWLHG
jgi:hypothetical protein